MQQIDMRILVAEDHPSLAQSITQGLREEGYAVDVSMTGTEAAHLAEADCYDAIVLDLMLPEKSGWDILRDMRRGGRTTPVLCLTALDSVEDRVRGLELGADDYLVKPFAWEELLARVRAMVRRGYSTKSTSITIADLIIDTAKKSASRAGVPISLSAREYSLLEYLAFRKDEVVSRTSIWEHLYDQHHETTSNVVDVYIGYLRNKIDRDHPVKLIHTRRGSGYMLSATG